MLRLDGTSKSRRGKKSWWSCWSLRKILSSECILCRAHRYIYIYIERERERERYIYTHTVIWNKVDRIWTPEHFNQSSLHLEQVWNSGSCQPHSLSTLGLLHTRIYVYIYMWIIRFLYTPTCIYIYYYDLWLFIYSHMQGHICMDMSSSLAPSASSGRFRHRGTHCWWQARRSRTIWSLSSSRAPIWREAQSSCVSRFYPISAGSHDSWVMSGSTKRGS